MDLAIWLSFLVVSGVVLAGLAHYSRKPVPVVVPVTSLSAVRARLAAEHRQRVSGTYVSAVRNRDPRLVQSFPSAHQRAEMADWKKRKP